MSRPTSPTYRTRNWPAYNEALKRRGSLTIWFDPEMSWDAAPTGRRGRQQTYSDAAIQTCLSMKVLFGMALRQTTGFVESLLQLVGLDWTVPDFSTLSRRQKTLAVSIPYRGSKGPLHLLIDSTGIKVEGEGEWHARKHGGPKRGPVRIKVPRSCPLGTMERIPPPKSRRNEDALPEAAGAEPHGTRLRSPGRGTPGPSRRAERLHRARHTCHRARRISASGVRGSPSFTLFAQQSPSDDPFKQTSGLCPITGCARCCAWPNPRRHR